MTKFFKPDPRLSAVGELVRGRFLIDVGTDHAILPIYLCLAGKIDSAIASDIRKGPLENAEKNISCHGLSEKISTVLTPGLHGMDGLSPSDIVIAGMGGIMIKDIISESDVARRSHLILQPMTHAHILREHLCENSFDITEERLAKADGRVYVILSAAYTGKKGNYSPAEIYAGRFSDIYKKENASLCSEHYGRLMAALKKKVDAGADAEAAELYKEIDAMKKEIVQ